MKATLSYKSKRNIIIASVIVALLAGISTAGYFYIKGNDETARAFTQDNITTGEQTQTEGGQQGNPEQNPEQPLTPDNQGDNNGDQSQGNQNQGNQPNTNNNGTPNQENGQVPSGEFVTEEVEERTVLVSEDYMVEWTPTNILANTTTSNLGIVRPIITASKTADKTAVVEGEIITYTITATNSGRADGKAVIKDTIPTGTTFVEGSIKVNNENTDYTAEDLQNGIEVNVSKQNEQGDGKTELVFQVRVNGLESDENDKKELVGVVENKATVNEIPTEEVKTPVIIFFKNAEQSTVKAGEKILYTITLVNSSEVSGKVIVKDEAPENTTFVEGSIKVNGVEKAELTEENLKNGIEVEVKENSEVTVTFEVTVNEQNSLNDGDIIKNTAYVNEKLSNETETEFNKPVINSEKIADKTAVVAGEKLTYTIKVTNTGKADGTATVKDEVPTGTEFVEGSIAINGSIKSSLTEKDLKEGIEVDVPKANENEAGTATVSFEVIVKQGTTGMLTNKATVNEIPTDEVKTPVITFNKKVDKETVKAEERLKYTITLKNTSEVLGKVTVRDNIPAETTFVDGSIELNEVQLKDKENNVLTKQDLEQGIEIEVAANSTVKLSFEVRVNSENNLNDGDIIKNTAYVNEKPSNEEKTEFNKPIISSEKEANKTAVVAGEKLTYTIKVTNTGKADGTATIKDEVPTGTEFVKGSIKVNGVEKAELTEKDLKEGIKVDVPKASTNGAGTATVSFEVIVKEGTTGMLTNEATVNEIPTDEVKTPVITFSKKADKETVKVGENILYTITLVNSSEVSGKVIVKDSAPTGTTFVKESIKVNGVEKAELTENDLKNGIEVEVKANSEATVSFEVTVNKNIESSNVINTAKVNDKDSNEEITKVVTYYTVEHYYKNRPDLTYKEKSGEMDIGKIITSYVLREQGKFKFVSDEGLPLTLVADSAQNVIKVYYEEPDITATKKDDSNGKKLVEGDKVEYTIDAINKGNVVGDATVTDEIPEGLKDISFAKTEIGKKDTVQLNRRTITWNVKDLKAGEKRTIKITATVVAVEKETTITNTVKVDGKPTDETTITVTKPIIESSKTATTILKRDNKGNVIPGQDSTKAEVGDTIIYTITATNKSDVESDIEISDDLSNLPVTFVDGSIKVNGSTSTKAKYENGKVTYKSTLSAKTTVTLEFRVTVNKGTTVKTVIRNVAIVNGEEKDATTTVVKKVCVKTTAETVNSLDMILVLDVSGSMKENKRLINLKSAAENLTNKLFSAQTDSTLTLIKYSTTASNPTTYQYDQKDQALKAIKNLKADGGTNFYKALEKTIDAVGDNPNRNTIVVFLTDGAPTFYTKDGEPGNYLVTSSNRSNDKNYENNLRPQIIQKAQELKAKPNTTIYSIGVGIAGNEVQYVERDVPAELQGIFDGTKDLEVGKGKNKQTITYHYMKVKTYAEYLLNNIASSGSYINTKDINSTFDDIFKQATSSEHIYMTEDVPVTINIPETKTIISDIQVKIGNGTPTAYTLNELRNGIDGLKYTDGVGFTWTITDINTLNKELYISYTVQGIANN